MPIPARPITQAALEFRERRRKDQYGLGHVGELRRRARDVVDEDYPTFGRVYGEYVIDRKGKPPPPFPEKQVPYYRPRTMGVPSFPTGGMSTAAVGNGGVSGCPDAIKFLRTVASSTSSRGRSSGGGVGEEEPWRGASPMLGGVGAHNYAERRARAEAHVEDLLSSVKSKRPMPSRVDASTPPWQKQDEAAAAAEEEAAARHRAQPRHGEEGYRYSRGGLPSSWGKMGAPPASGGGGESKGRAAWTGPPVGTPLDEAAMKKHMEQQGVAAAAAAARGPRTPGTPGGGVGGSRRGTAASDRPVTGSVAGPGTPSRSRGGVSTSRSRLATGASGRRGGGGGGVVNGINLDDDTTEALLDELTRRGLMPGRPDTASMEAALKNLAASWDKDGGGGESRGGMASRRGTQHSRGG